ncbi:MAG: sugar phosphate isomerase/epimerase [Clostridia bacterium]|nr:sugar phosphate isomerase/epimerase [Clostridia bacterium]
MRLSLENYILRNRFGEEEAIKMAKEAGFDAIDYSYYWLDENSEILGENYLEYAKNVKKLLEKYGLVCNQAHAPFDLKYDDNLDMSNEKYLCLVRSIEAAGLIGAENIVVHTIHMPENSEKGFWEYNQNFYKGLAPFAQKAGIKIAVENLFCRDSKRQCISRQGRLATPEMLSRFVKELGTDNFSACIDLGHAAISGTEPEDFICGMEKGLIKALHVQDTDYLDDRHTIPYAAKHNWQNITRALKDYGYSGDLTFETLKFIQGFPDKLMPKCLEFMASIGRYLIDLIEN